MPYHRRGKSGFWFGHFAGFEKITEFARELKY